MKVNQIAQIINTINNEMIGETALVSENLSNIVDVGKTVTDFLAAGNKFDNYIASMIDRIGRVMFVDRKYESKAPSIVKDSWEYGSILMKVRAEIPDAVDNLTWPTGNNTSLSDLVGQSIDPFVINTPSATAKMYNKKTTFEVDMTFAEYQLREAFTSADEMGRFFAMIENRIAMKLTLCTDALIMRTINNLIAMKLSSGQNVINLLTEYNTAYGTSLTANAAQKDPDFLKFAAKTVALYKEFMSHASTAYNNGSYVTFTPADRLKAVFLSDFAKDMEVYLYGDTYHNEFVKLAGYEEVPYWQGMGTAGSFADRSKIMATVEELNNLGIAGTGNIDTTAVNQSGIVAVLFDEEAAVVCNDNFRVTSIYNPRGEYTNFFYKYDSSQINDVEENCVVFLIADTAD